MGQNGGMDFGAMLQGAGKQLLNQGGQALMQYGAQAIGNIINEVFQKKEVEQKRFLPSIKNYKVGIPEVDVQVAPGDRQGSNYYYKKN
ncbi:hypothetical protein SFRURICE_007372 [Spodoptera frugiperda]|nr:hypothetical protein SFRURICE_007372 [Spodoptera frugiperda]